MFIRDSTRKGVGQPAVRTGPRTRHTSQGPGLSSGVKESSYRNGLWREYPESGVYTIAEASGIQNGHINIPQGVSLDESFDGSTGASDFRSATSDGFGGPSVSLDSGSAGSPSRVSDATMFSPDGMAASKFQQLECVQNSPDMVGRRKKRIHRSSLGEKGGKGLRHFSMRVLEKVESKGQTTYNEVADELVAEYTNPASALVSPDQRQYDEKNIRRRVYDALNVLMAVDIISKDKKEIQWKGLPSTTFGDIEQLKEERIRVRSRIDKKKKYIQELEEQIAGLQNLVQRNERLYNSTGSFPSGGVALPFILVQTRPQATVEVEISEDMQVVHFDFNSTPFELHDDASVLKAMKFCDQPRGSDTDGYEDPGDIENAFDIRSSPLLQCSMPSYVSCNGSTVARAVSYSPGKSCISPPAPGILKARFKQESFG